jgi:uncharacterized membrane protein (UPF0127 family)
VSRRGRLAAAAVVAVASLTGIVALAIVQLRGSNERVGLHLTTSSTGVSPFHAFAESRVAVDGRCLRVLVARTTAQRVQGLRDVRSLGQYDGMLFVFPSSTNAQFTMAATPLPLDIGWYASDGAPVDRTRMTPCPHGTDATCPAYASRRRYRYALERRAGQLGSGALSACAA